MENSASSTTYSLFDLLDIFWRGKWIIVGSACSAVAIGTTYALLAEPLYRSETTIALAEREVSAGDVRGLGGLASLAGIATPGSSIQHENLAILRSRSLARAFIENQDLMPVIFSDDWDREAQEWLLEKPPAMEEAVEYFVTNVREVEENTSTGLVLLSIEWRKANQAQDWALALVQTANEAIRRRDLAASERRLDYLKEQLAEASLVELRQAISRLIEAEVQTIMLARAEPEYAFKMIDPPVAPTQPFFPNIRLFAFVAFVAGTLIGLAICLGKALIRQRHIGTDR